MSLEMMRAQHDDETATSRRPLAHHTDETGQQLVILAGLVILASGCGSSGVSVGVDPGVLPHSALRTDAVRIPRALWSC